MPSRHCFTCTQSWPCMSRHSLSIERPGPRTHPRWAMTSWPSGVHESLHAELVAFGVLQDDPVLVRFPLGPRGLVPHFLLGRAQTQKPVDLLVDLSSPRLRRRRIPAADVQVQVKAILPRLRRVHLLKEDPGSPTLRINDRARGIPFVLGH